MSYQLLPFNFERLPSGRVFVSSMAGGYSVLPDIDTVEKIIQRDVNPSSELFGRLHKKGLIAADGDEKAAYSALTASSLAYRYQTSLCRPQLFIIVPTLRCDHDCLYCQVSRAQQGAVGYDLSRDKIPRIAQLVADIGRPPYKIEFQGGEPLLAFDFVREFVEYFDALVVSNATEYVIATSLSPLTEEMVTWSETRNVHFSVSIDGTAVIHNASRRHQSIDSHRVATHNIHLLYESLGNDRVSTVTTVTQPLLQHPEAILDAHEVLGLENLFVRPLSPYGFATGKQYKSYGIGEYVNFLRQLLQEIVRRAGAGEQFVEHYTLLHLRRILQSGFDGYVDLKSPTGYVLGALVFDYSGKVFGSDEARMLYKMYEIESLVLGSVDDTRFQFGRELTTESVLASSFITDLPGCETCAYQPYCGVDAMHHLATQADPIGDKSLSHFCQLQKGMFGLLVDMLEDAEASRVLKGWLQ